MNRGQEYERRKSFIEKGVGMMMSAKEDFESIQYARSGLNQQEYIRMKDIFGSAVTLCITDYSLEKILQDVCRIILIGEENVSMPKGVITEKEKLREISHLFH